MKAKIINDAEDAKHAAYTQRAFREFHKRMDDQEQFLAGQRSKPFIPPRVDRIIEPTSPWAKATAPKPIRRSAHDNLVKPDGKNVAVNPQKGGLNIGDFHLGQGYILVHRIFFETHHVHKLPVANQDGYMFSRNGIMTHMDKKRNKPFFDEAVQNIPCTLGQVLLPTDYQVNKMLAAQETVAKLGKYGVGFIVSVNRMSGGHDSVTLHDFWHASTPDEFDVLGHIVGTNRVMSLKEMSPMLTGGRVIKIDNGSMFVNDKIV